MVPRLHLHWKLQFSSTVFWTLAASVLALLALNTEQWLGHVPYNEVSTTSGGKTYYARDKARGDSCDGKNSENYIRFIGLKSFQTEFCDSKKQLWARLVSGCAVQTGSCLKKGLDDFETVYSAGLAGDTDVFKNDLRNLRSGMAGAYFFTVSTVILVLLGLILTASTTAGLPVPSSANAVVLGVAAITSTLAVVIVAAVRLSDEYKIVSTDAEWRINYGTQMMYLGSSWGYMLTSCIACYAAYFFNWIAATFEKSSRKKD